MPGPKNLLADIWLLASVATALVAEELADNPLSVDEFAIYGLISDLGPVTATQLGQWTGISPTTLSATLRRCQARGEITRTPNAADRRSNLVELTSHGRTVYEAALPALRAAQARLAEHLGDADDGARLAIQEVDAATRKALRLPGRPYQVTADTSLPDTDQIGLSPAQLSEVRAFTAWIRHRDARP